MRAPLSDLGVAVPVIAAPMAGGPGTPALAIAAGRAGGLGFIPAALKTPDGMAEDIAAVRAASVSFGVNLFAPNPVLVDRGAYHRYAQALRADPGHHGVELAAEEPVEDDDAFPAKLDALLADPVPLVSFTFGLPPASTFAALRRAGTLAMQSVTSVEEARAAVEAGADALTVQASTAGGHSATLTPGSPPAPVPLTDLIALVRQETTLPIVAAGGLATPADVAAVIRAGADAVAVGTPLLRTDEAGTNALHRATLAEGTRDTVVTRAFTGRPARGLRNTFIDRYEDLAPLGYPALHHLTGPLRRAAMAAGDPERLNMWAGTGYRHATEGPAAAVIAGLASDL